MNLWIFHDQLGYLHCEQITFRTNSVPIRQRVECVRKLVVNMISLFIREKLSFEKIVYVKIMSTTLKTYLWQGFTGLPT